MKFYVFCAFISEASRHRKIVELLEDMLLQRFRDSAQEVADTFQGIFAQLRKAGISSSKCMYYICAHICGYDIVSMSYLVYLETVLIICMLYHCTRKAPKNIEQSTELREFMSAAASWM